MPLEPVDLKLAQSPQVAVMTEDSVYKELAELRRALKQLQDKINEIVEVVNGL